jgi:probable rRNA maturation factor
VLLKDYSNIFFEFSGVSIPDFDEDQIRNWIRTVLQNEGAEPGYLQFIFCNDKNLLELNESFLKHHTLTDIITFNYNEELGGISGDIFISYERIIDNAVKYKVAPGTELRRVIVHGVLHLLGYDDKDEPSRRLMRSKENYYLSLCV